MKPAVFLKQANSQRPAMGLENLGLSAFEGATTTYSPCIFKGKVQHGLTGKEDIKIVEEHYGMKLDDPTRANDWANLILSVNHDIVPLDLSNGEDLLRLSVLRAQGKLAPSIEEQADPNANYFFVLVDEGAEDEAKASIYARRTGAQIKLLEIKNDAPKYLLALSKYLINFQAGVNNVEAAYAKLCEYIDGKLTKGKKSDALDIFLRTLDPAYGGQTNREEIFLRVDIQKAINLQIIRRNDVKGHFYNAAIPDSNYGRTPDEVYSFLTLLSNTDQLGTGNDSDAPYAIRWQLKQAEL